MYFLQRRHSPYHAAQLLRPSFDHTLANPEERMKCGGSKQQANRTSVSDSYIHVVDEKDQFLLYTDLPGVKTQDLKVDLTDKSIIRIHGERKKGGETTQFDRRFMVDDQLIETSKITASLSDGTLEIIGPKKQATKPRKIAVVAGLPTEEDESALSFELDLPGVKIETLEVEVHDDGKLVISAERKRGGKTTNIQRAFSLNLRAVDTNKVEAFLEDGVFTVRAPKKEPIVGRTIPVSSSSDKVDDKEGDIETRTVEPKNETPEPQEALLVGEDRAPTKDDKEEEEFHDVKETEKEPSSEEKSVDKSSVSSYEEYEVVPETVTEDDE